MENASVMKSEEKKEQFFCDLCNKEIILEEGQTDIKEGIVSISLQGYFKGRGKYSSYETFHCCQSCGCNLLGAFYLTRGESLGKGKKFFSNFRKKFVSV